MQLTWLVSAARLDSDSLVLTHVGDGAGAVSAARLPMPPRCCEWQLADSPVFLAQYSHSSHSLEACTVVLVLYLPFLMLTCTFARYPPALPSSSSWHSWQS